MHFWTIIGKAKMCLRSEQLVHIYRLFVYKYYKVLKNDAQFQSCFHGFVTLWIRDLADIPKVWVQILPHVNRFYQKSFIFSSRFSIINICLKIVLSSNAFWLYQLGVRTFLVNPIPFRNFWSKKSQNLALVCNFRYLNHFY